MAPGDCLSTLLVGIDGAGERVLGPLFDDGALPTLQRVLDAGASGPLESQVPPWTASAWPSLYTGTNPGRHGVFDFLAFDGYDWEVVDATDVHRPPLWQLLDHHGLSSVVVNVPVTYPPEPFDGALVPGYAAPEDPTCHPSGLLDDVRAAVGDYRVYPAHQGAATPSPAEQRAEYVELTRLRGAAFRYLVDRFEPTFGFVQFQQTDTMIHERPGDDETARAVYRAVDEELAAVLERHDPGTVVVASDHGVGPYEGWEFRVNEFLRERGAVVPVRGGAGMPTWATVRDRQLAAGDDEAKPRTGALARAMAAAARVGLTSQRVAAVLGRLGIDGVVRRHVPASLASAASEQVDFPASEAYMRSRIECGVRINLEGREPKGTVPAGEYERTRQELIDALRAVRTPDGDPVFEDVARREEYFEGPYAERAVDVVTVPAAFDHFLSSRLSGATFGEPSEPWNHKREGVVAMTGDGVEEPLTVEGAHLFDVAPTVLATLGLPADVRMDGDVLHPVEPAGDLDYPAPDPTRTASTDHAVEDRLADLGYIE